MKSICISVLILLVLVCSLAAVTPPEANFGAPPSLEVIAIGVASPKTSKGATAILRVVRASDDDALLIWHQAGKKNPLTITVPVAAVPKLAPLTVGRTREFFAAVSGSGEAKEWLAFELVPEAVP